MSDQPASSSPGRPTVVLPEPAAAAQESPEDTIISPAKVLRIGGMTKQLLDEVRRAPLDDAGRARLREVYETSVRELGECLSPDLREELGRLTSPFNSDVPSEAELRVVQAQLVGWLEGLFHGIQAALFSQQMAARQQLEEMRGRGLPPGAMPGSPGQEPMRPGTYL
jgi:hypothetical protein